MKSPTPTSRIPRRNGIRQPRETSSASGGRAKKKTAVERKSPASVPAWGQLA
jgi:hypothetical protein